MEERMNIQQTSPIAVSEAVRPAPEVVPVSPNKPVPVEVPSAASATPQEVYSATSKYTPEAVAPSRPAAQPVASAAPVAPTAPVASAAQPVATAAPVAPAVQPVATAAPMATAVPVASAAQPVSSVTPAPQPTPASQPTSAAQPMPAMNSSMINPMPERTVPSAITTPAEASTAGTNAEEPAHNEKADKKAARKAAKIEKAANKEKADNIENKKNKEKRGLGVAQTILISAAVGLLFGVIGTVGMFFVQKNTTVLDKFITTNQDVAEVEPVDNTDPTTVDGTVGTTTDTLTDTSSSNSFNTAYTTVITGESDVITVTENAMPSMVSIIKEYNYVDSSLIQYFGAQSYVTEASGSGFIIAETDTEYLIVSNNHVVENPITLTVTFVDGSKAYAYIKGCDKGKDIAVIAVLKNDVSDSTVGQIRIASLGDSNHLKLGEQVVAIGNALGYGQSVTTGIISALDREMETEEGYTNKFIQTDAAINPGNSGGALLNMAGQVIGINSNKLAETSVEGMGYAIPISDVTDIIEELMEHSTKIPLPDDEVGYIGINLQEVTESLSQRFSMPVGIYIVETVDGGAAEAAGLQAGDIITEFDGEKITSYDELDRVLQCYAAGTTVTITYMRQENGVYVEHTTELTLGTKP